MAHCTDLKGSCCVERVEVLEHRETWIIRRRPEFNALLQFRAPDPAYPDIFITPGQDPKDPFHIVPIEIIYPKKYADLRRVIEEVIPALRAKEDECGICKEAQSFIKRMAERRR